jgi:hypothetical protein
MHMVIKGLIILTVISICLSVCGCEEPPAVPTPKPTPTPTAQSLSVEQVMADFGVYDIPATTSDIAASRATLNFAPCVLRVCEKAGTCTKTYTLEVK